MTNPIGSSGSAGSSTDPNTAVATAPPVLGKDDFLQMLVAQLKNQDPLNPMDGTQFAAQLAQFSTVEQLTDLNTTATAQASATAQQTLTQQVSFGNSLIGRDVVTSGQNINVVDGQASRVSVDVTGAPENVHIDIMGADGTTVIGSQDFSNATSGTNTLSIDTSKVAAGNYSYKVSATDSSGKALAVSGFTVGTVQGTGFQNGSVVLTVNGAAVPISDIVEIIPSASAADPANSSTTK